MTMFCRELTIDELLSSPVTQAIMQADRVDPSGVRAMLWSVEIESAARQADDSAPESHHAPSGRNAFGRWSRSLAGRRTATSARRDAGLGMRSRLRGDC